MIPSWMSFLKRKLSWQWQRNNYFTPKLNEEGFL